MRPCLSERSVPQVSRQGAQNAVELSQCRSKLQRAEHMLTAAYAANAAMQVRLQQVCCSVKPVMPFTLSTKGPHEDMPLLQQRSALQCCLLHTRLCLICSELFHPAFTCVEGTPLSMLPECVY